MDFDAYLRVLLSVWVGLGLGQLVQALHRLARFKGSIRWDWIPVTWAALAFLMFVQTWWAYFTILHVEIWINLFAFLLPLSVFVILYLICASALPDTSRSPEGSVVDMRSHYHEQRRYFFTLWALFLLFALIVSSMTRDGLRLLGGDGFRVAGLFAAILLRQSSGRRTHAVVTVLSFVALITYIMLFSIRLV